MAFDVADAAPVAAFWTALLGREVRPEPGAVLVPGDPTQVGLRFVTSESAQVRPRRLHLHLTSDSPEQQRRTVHRVLELGGSHLDVGQGPEESFVVMADPGGGELCVIEAGNRYLQGTGFLGEVTCDAPPPEVGRFWHAALRWPLVLDQDGQTAIQSPHGGTKISFDSWEDDSAPPRDLRSRQRYDLLSEDLDAATERLVARGATLLGERDGGVEMTDPDGFDFGLRRL